MGKDEVEHALVGQTRRHCAGIGAVVNSDCVDAGCEGGEMRNAQLGSARCCCVVVHKRPQLQRLVDAVADSHQRIVDSRLQREMPGDGHNVGPVGLISMRDSPAGSATSFATSPNDPKRPVVCLDFEWRCTPEHASWLNIAECELSFLATQRLNQWIADQATLAQEVSAWVERRNRTCAKIVRQFTTADARIKLKRLYPVVKVQNPA